MEVQNTSLLEASRRSWKEGGAISESEYKGTQSVKSVGSWFSGGLLLLLLLGGLGLWRSGLWSDPFVGARSRWRVRASHQGRGLEEPLCQLCRTNLRVRVRSAGESSPAPCLARAQPRLSQLPWGQTSRLVHRGTSRVQVTCNGLVGPFRSPRPHVIKAYGPRLTPLSVRGSFFAFLLNECWWRCL